MKPLLRSVLVIYALLYLIAGLLYLLLSPVTLFHRVQLDAGALSAMALERTMIEQLFGVALLGFAALSLQGVINGTMTARAARIAGHVMWMAGVLILVWLIGLSMELLPGYGALINGLGGAVLVVAGLGGVRLSAAVRYSEKTMAKAREDVASPSAQASGMAGPAAVPPRSEREGAAELALKPESAAKPAPEPQSEREPMPKSEAEPERAGRERAEHLAASPSEPVSALLTPREALLRDEARDDAADSPGKSRPPFHG
jgi:hypothetical protein